MYSIWFHFDFTLLLDIQEVEQMCISSANLSTSADKWAKARKVLFDLHYSKLLLKAVDTGRWEAASTTETGMGNSDQAYLSHMGNSTLFTLAGTMCTPHAWHSQKAIKLWRLWSHHIRLRLYLPLSEVASLKSWQPSADRNKELRSSTNLTTIPKAGFHNDFTHEDSFLRLQQTENLNRC